MRRRFKKLLFVFSILFFLITVISAVIFIYFENNLASQLKVYARKAAENKIGSAVNLAVISELENAGITYDSIIDIDKDEGGRITSVRADMMAVNFAKSRLDVAVAEYCDGAEFYQLKIPVGNLLGNALFYGKGFELTVRFRPLGASSTRMTGVFSEAGMNQTLYRIAFTVSADTAIVFPFNYTEIPIECETVIAETIIVGDVPESFTHFDLQGDITAQDFQGYVEDYMAE